MKPGMIAVTTQMKQEVLAAVAAVKRPNSVYVTRSGIETELSAYPDRYPRLAIEDRDYQRQVITKVMKRMYARWGDSTSNKSHSWVWNLSRPVAVLPRTDCGPGDRDDR